MKKKWLWFGALMAASIMVAPCARFVMADTENVAESEKVGAPRPIRFPTHDYVPESVSETSQRGETLYKDLNCLQCHSIKNAGGNLGPMLDGIGYRRSADFIYAHLANSRQAEELYFRLTGQRAEKYHHSRVSPEQASALVAFLMTVPEPEGGFVLMPHVMSLPAAKPEIKKGYKPQLESKSSREGAKLFKEKGCIACHTIDHIGGWLGPKLNGIGGRLERSQIAENIANPAAVSKSEAGNIDVLPQMPRLKLSQSEIEKLTDYLLTLPNSEDAE